MSRVAQAFQRGVLKAMLSLPAPVLQMLSGGEAEQRGGRTLDARVQFLARATSAQTPMSSMTPEQARAAHRRGLRLVAGHAEPGVRFKSLKIDAPQGALPARVYRPKKLDPQAPLLLYLHGGGGVIGDLATSHALCTLLARIGQGSVLSLDYRLAPEHRFPAAVDDVVFVGRWARENAARFGAPADRLAVGGDSMGAMLAAVFAQEQKRQGLAQPDLQLLIYPAVEISSSTQSMTTYADDFPLGDGVMEWFREHYAGPSPDPDDPRLFPLHTADLSGLAPAIVVTAGFDPLVDQGEAYAHRLIEAKVPTLYRCYDSLPHGFATMTGAVPAADIACRELAGLFRQGLEGLLPAAAAVRI